MGHATKDVARLVISHLEPLPHFLDQGLIACAVALNELARSFIDDDKVVVDVNNFHASSALCYIYNNV